MTRTRLAASVLCCLALLAGPTVVSAQDITEDASQAARMRLGPLWLTPRFALRDVGVDTNVFNSSVDPVRDVTATFSPGADAWLHIGRGMISSKTSIDWLRFADSTDQRSFNLSEEARLDVALARAVPYVGGTYVTTRQRPNDEIDLRVQQRRTGGLFGIGLLLGARLRVDVAGQQTRFDFSEGRYGDPEYADALNRRTREGHLDASYAVTPLTSIVIRSAVRTDRFEYSDLRNADSVSVMPGVQFKPLALVSGTAFVGYRRFTTTRADVADYSGVIASLELKYVARDMTRFVGKVSRDVDYSFEENEPFFVASSAALEMTQAIGLNWDVVGRVRRAVLDYPEVDSLTAAGRDRVLEVGTGLGRRLGTYLRVGIDFAYADRSSNRPGRGFVGYRYGGSVTYGY